MKKVKVKTRETTKATDSPGKELLKKPPKSQVVKLPSKKSRFRLPSLGAYWNRMKEFLTEAVYELKKVTWPSRKETIGATAVVILLVIILSSFLGIVDLALSRLVKQIIG